MKQPQTSKLIFSGSIANVLWITLIVFLLNIQAANSQTVYIQNYDTTVTNCAGSPYRAATYTSSCTYGNTALTCAPNGGLATWKECLGCTNTSQCNSPNPSVTTNQCRENSIVTCNKPAEANPRSGFITYVDFSNSRINCPLSGGVVYNQTKLQCVDGLETWECLQDGSGVRLTSYVGGSGCSRVSTTETYPFNQCSVVTFGSRYYRFLSCSPAVGNSARGIELTFVTLFATILMILACY